MLGQELLSNGPYCHVSSNARALLLTLENALIKFPLLSEHECLAISHTCAIFILRSEALTFDECSQELGATRRASEARGVPRFARSVGVSLLGLCPSISLASREAKELCSIEQSSITNAQARSASPSMRANAGTMLHVILPASRHLRRSSVIAAMFARQVVRLRY